MRTNLRYQTGVPHRLASSARLCSRSLHHGCRPTDDRVMSDRSRHRERACSPAQMIWCSSKAWRMAELVWQRAYGPRVDRKFGTRAAAHSRTQPMHGEGQDPAALRNQFCWFCEALALPSIPALSRNDRYRAASGKFSTTNLFRLLRRIRNYGKCARVEPFPDGIPLA